MYVSMQIYQTLTILQLSSNLSEYQGWLLKPTFTGWLLPRFMCFAMHEYQTVITITDTNTNHIKHIYKAKIFLRGQQNLILPYHFIY